MNSEAASILKSPAIDDEFVQKRCFTMQAYTTVGGKLIKDLKVGWESYGRLSSDKSNVILVPHYYSGNSHVAGRYTAADPAPGYWDSIIGPGKPLDTNRFFVIGIDSLVNLNSKDGITITTGPDSINPDTGKQYGMQFPVVTIKDFVRVQKALMDSLGIKKIFAAAGVSMGALQSFEWAAAYPGMVDRVIAVNGTAAQRPSALCSLGTWCDPIKIDPNWNNGDYYGGPEPISGLALAFYNVNVSAHHPKFFATNFQYKWAEEGKNPADDLGNDFESVKAFKSFSFVRATNTTDANTMLYMTRANQLFYVGSQGSSVAEGLKNIKARTLVIQSASDLLFPMQDAKDQVEMLKANGTDAEFAELDSPWGHISGITDIAKAGDAIRNFLAA
jgi:homoserine O-acetyltransferase